MKILALDPFVVARNACPSCMGNLSEVYSLDPFAYSPRGLGALGLDAAHQTRMDQIVQGIVAKGDNCNDYLTWVDTYTRLSRKDKKKETLVAAKELASLFQQKYNDCVERKATTAVQTALGTGTLLQQYAASQGQAQAPVTAQPTAPVQQQAAPTGWMTPKTLLMIGGGVLAVGLVVYLMRRK